MGGRGVNGQRRKFTAEYKREAVGMLDTSEAAHQVTCSMSAVGSCPDNAAAESFLGVLKRECMNRRQYRTRAEAQADFLLNLSLRASALTFR